MEKRQTLQIRFEKSYDPKNLEQKQEYDDVVKQYTSSNNEHNISNPDISAVSDISDYATSDIESTPSLSPRINNLEPVCMTTFDLIGMVSSVN